MPAKCRMDGCDGEGTCCIDYTFKAEKDGVKETLHKIVKPYCLDCLAQVLRALQVGMPPALYLRLTEDMTAAGYEVSGEGWTATGTLIEESFQGEYVPAPGKCHYRNCPNDATVKPVVVIPLLKPHGAEAYSAGDGVCNQHIQERLSINRVDPGGLRVALLRLAATGVTPILAQIRVEARLVEWKPPGQHVMITDNVSKDARKEYLQTAHKKASNAHNN